MIKKIILALSLISEYFHHPLPNIRQAMPIRPWKPYRTFGRVCYARPMSRKEREALKSWPDTALPVSYLERASESADELGYIGRAYLQGITADSADNVPARCNLCDFYLRGLPCPLYNRLKNGGVVCNTNRYRIAE